MPQFVTADAFEDRLRSAVTVAWKIFCAQVGSGRLEINKEASMQLQYAYILRQLLPMTLRSLEERADIELETGRKTASGHNNIDILVKGASGHNPINVAVELKCYRTVTSSGGKRGAQDIFMKDIYEDLHALEEYVSEGVATHGVALIMVDQRWFTAPPTPRPGAALAKCWDYNTSHGFTHPGGTITTQVGSVKKQPIRVVLKKKHTFEWKQIGKFWFAEIEGV